jgi:hypothetical protein
MGIGKCCWCLEPELDCPRICIGKAPCDVTRLVITGHHPADLRFGINYTKDEYDCRLRGYADVNRSTSTGHTHLKSWTSSEKWWDSVVRNILGCPCPGGALLTLRQEIGNGYVAQTTCARADLRYHGLNVAVYRGLQYGPYGTTTCGVWVVACLYVRRRMTTRTQGCRSDYARINHYSTPCSEPIDPVQEARCGYCYDAATNTYSTFTGPSDPTTAPYPAAPSALCQDLTDAEWASIPTLCIVRHKFLQVPSILCEPLVVTLSPADASSWFGTMGCCSSPGPPDVITYEEEDDPSDIPYAISGGCGLSPTTAIEYGTWLPSGSQIIGGSVGTGQFNPPLCTGDFNVTIPAVAGLHNQTQRKRGWDRTGGWTGSPTLFGEAEDTWTLHLECSN